ncbi:MFS transporter [soil metagenome]
MTRRPRTHAHWGMFALVCLAYLGVTVGEQALSPVLPGVRVDIAMSESQAGTAFGLLALSIAATNLIGGAVVGRWGARTMMLAGLVGTVAGSVAAATAHGFGGILISQLLLGAGAGLYFPAGLQAVGQLAGPARRGFAMGIYGVAFSAGLTVAAVLGAFGGTHGWRIAFWCSAGLGVAAFAATLMLRLGPPTGAAFSMRFPRRAVIGVPTFVGAVGAVCQYGAIPFLTTFAVSEWGLRAGQAAAVLAVGRVISILAKLISGAGTDRVGPIVSARRTAVVLVATGIAWVLLPAGWPTYACAAVFAGTVSSLFPVANMVAIDHFGNHGPSLGAYRSAQIGIGALAGWLIGLLAGSVGLRPVLLAAVVSPVLLLVFLRPASPAPSAVAVPASTR